VNIRDVKETLDATVIEGEDRLDTPVEDIYASDLMSDVLAFGHPRSLLLTGLATKQAVISAHMAEFAAVAFIRGKRPKDGSAEFARSSQLVLLSTQVDMYEACVRFAALRHWGRIPVPVEPVSTLADDILLHQEFTIAGNDFVSAGAVSTEVKSILKTIGFDPQLIRRVAISTFEAEMNVVMHARRAKVLLSVTPHRIEVVIDDEGRGIPDVNLAMQAGYSTATEEMRAMGFGSGMGLPNIRKNTDELDIRSEVDHGTRLRMRFHA